MKKLDTQFSTPTVGQPLKAGSIDHLQDSYKEIAANLVKQRRPSVLTTDVLILWGCVNSGSGLVYNISAGAVYFNGEIYDVPAASFTSPGGQEAVGTISESPSLTEDPTTFEDGSTHNVHITRRIVIASGVSGSGTKDFADWISEGWIPVTAYTAPYEADANADIALQYRLIGNKVELRGRIDTNVGESNVIVSSAILTMPVGLRPKRTNFQNICNQITGVIQPAVPAQITSAGVLSLRGDLIPFDDHSVYLDGFYYYID